ncbi:Uncharacterised protein [Mycobacteroides abscessus subsp. abscessus]|nr:Uncharacterised protein [Mycobacteroides abscessus subsp. abscessus]
MSSRCRAEAARDKHQSQAKQLSRERADRELQTYRARIEALIAAWDQSKTTICDLQIMSTAIDVLSWGPFAGSNGERVPYRRPGHDDSDNNSLVTPWLPDAHHHLHPWIHPWEAQTIHRLTAVLNTLGWTYTIIDSDQPGKNLGLGIQTRTQATAVLATYDTDGHHWHPPHMLIVGERTGLLTDELDNLWTRLYRDGRVKGIFLAADIALRPHFESRQALTNGHMYVPGDCIYPPTAALKAELAQLPPNAEEAGDTASDIGYFTHDELLNQGWVGNLR